MVKNKFSQAELEQVLAKSMTYDYRTKDTPINDGGEYKQSLLKIN